MIYRDEKNVLLKSTIGCVCVYTCFLDLPRKNVSSLIESFDITNVSAASV